MPSARELGDSLLIPEVRHVHAENCLVYGIRKSGTLSTAKAFILAAIRLPG